MIKYLLFLCLISSSVLAQDCTPGRAPEPTPAPAPGPTSTTPHTEDRNECERHMVGIFEVCTYNGPGNGVLFQSHTPTHPYNHGH